MLTRRSCSVIIFSLYQKKQQQAQTHTYNVFGPNHSISIKPALVYNFCTFSNKSTSKKRQVYFISPASCEKLPKKRQENIKITFSLTDPRHACQTEPSTSGVPAPTNYSITLQYTAINLRWTFVTTTDHTRNRCASPLVAG